MSLYGNMFVTGCNRGPVLLLQAVSTGGYAPAAVAAQGIRASHNTPAALSRRTAARRGCARGPLSYFHYADAGIPNLFN